MRDGTPGRRTTGRSSRGRLSKPLVSVLTYLCLGGSESLSPAPALVRREVRGSRSAGGQGLEYGRDVCRHCDPRVPR